MIGNIQINIGVRCQSLINFLLNHLTRKVHILKA